MKLIVLFSIHVREIQIRDHLHEWAKWKYNFVNSLVSKTQCRLSDSRLIIALQVNSTVRDFWKSIRYLILFSLILCSIIHVEL